MQKIFLVTFLLVNIQLFAQPATNKYKKIDDYIKSLGPLDTLNAGTIAYVVTKNFKEPIEKVRAIFDWVAFNINFDYKSAKNNNNQKISSDEILKSRKATSTGYASLFQDMCSVVKIRCLTVDGYIKNTSEAINEKPDGTNHTWAVVQLGQSPESWFYVDPTLASGYTDDKLTGFTKEFNDAYFFSDRKIFNTQHFADNSAWQLGGGSKSLKDFTGMPLIKHAAYQYHLSDFTPASGYIKTKIKKPVQFSFTINAETPVEIVSLAIGEGKKKKVKTADYKFLNGVISFSFAFDEGDTYPVTLLINNTPVIGYLVEVKE